MTPSSEAAQRVAILFGRRLTTHWSDKEIRVFKKLVKMQVMDSESLNLMERYYAAQRAKKGEGIHRRDLYTLLNNWTGELDRAREWFTRRQSVKTPKTKAKPLGTSTDEDYKRVGEEARRVLADLRKQLGFSEKAASDSETPIGCPTRSEAVKPNSGNAEPTDGRRDSLAAFLI